MCRGRAEHDADAARSQCWTGTGSFVLRGGSLGRVDRSPGPRYGGRSEVRACSVTIFRHIVISAGRKAVLLLNALRKDDHEDSRVGRFGAISAAAGACLLVAVQAPSASGSVFTATLESVSSDKCATVKTRARPTRPTCAGGLRKVVLDHFQCQLSKTADRLDPVRLLRRRQPEVPARLSTRPFVFRVVTGEGPGRAQVMEWVRVPRSDLVFTGPAAGSAGDAPGHEGDECQGQVGFAVLWKPPGGEAAGDAPGRPARNPHAGSPCHPSPWGDCFPVSHDPLGASQ